MKKKIIKFFVEISALESDKISKLFLMLLYMDSYTRTTKQELDLVHYSDA